jgi:hypothetical protein
MGSVRNFTLKVLLTGVHCGTMENKRKCETDQMSCRMRVDGQAFDEADQARHLEVQSLSNIDRVCNCHKSLFGHDK